jgi:hypothetical protein
MTQPIKETQEQNSNGKRSMPQVVQNHPDTGAET